MNATKIAIYFQKQYLSEKEDKEKEKNFAV